MEKPTLNFKSEKTNQGQGRKLTRFERKLDKAHKQKIRELRIKKYRRQDRDR